MHALDLSRVGRLLASSVVLRPRTPRPMSRTGIEPVRRDLVGIRRLLKLSQAAPTADSSSATLWTAQRAELPHPGERYLR